MTKREFVDLCGRDLPSWGMSDATFLVEETLLHPAGPDGFASWQIVQVAAAAEFGVLPLAALRLALTTAPKPEAWGQSVAKITGRLAEVLKAFAPVEAIRHALLERPLPPLKERQVAEYVAHLRREGIREAAAWYDAMGKRAQTIEELYELERKYRDPSLPRNRRLPSPGPDEKGPPLLRDFLTGKTHFRRRRHAFAAEIRAASKTSGATPDSLLSAWETLADLRNDFRHMPAVSNHLVEARRDIERILWVTHPNVIRGALTGDRKKDRAKDRWKANPSLESELDRCPICGELITPDEHRQAVRLEAKGPRDAFAAVMGRVVHRGCYITRRKNLRQRLLMRKRTASQKIKTPAPKPSRRGIRNRAMLGAAISASVKRRGPRP